MTWVLSKPRARMLNSYCFTYFNAVLVSEHFISVVKHDPLDDF